MSKWLGAVVSSFDRSDLLVLIGLTLVGAGAWHISKPIAAIVVGAVVLWYGMPSRPPFIGGSK